MRTKKEHFVFIAVLCCLVTSPWVLCYCAGGATASVEIIARVSLTGYDIIATNITNNSANITWMTNGPTDSTVEYGSTIDYSFLKTSSEMVSNHSISLNGLSAGQLYHYLVVSADSAGTTYTSTDFTFKTLNGQSFTSSSAGGGSSSSSAIGNIIGMPAFDLPAISPELVIASGSPIPLTDDNLVAEPVVITSSDRSATLSIDADTRLLDKEGNPLDKISLSRIETKDVPNIPKGSLFVFSGYAYQIEPSGAIFSPPVGLKITTTPEEWNLITGKDLSIQYYNPASSLWEELPTTTDPAAHTATTRLSHASEYGLFIKSASTTNPGVTPIENKGISPVGSAPGVIHELVWIMPFQGIILITAAVFVVIIGLLMYLRRHVQ